MLEEISRAEKSASGSLEISSPAAAPTRRISIPSLTEVSPELSFESRGNPGESAAASAGQQVPHSDRGPRLLPVSSGLFPVLPGMDSRFAAAAAAFAAQQVPHSAGGMSELPINRVLFPGVPQVPQRSLAPRTADESAAGAALAGPYPLPRSTDERAPGTNTGHLG